MNLDEGEHGRADEDRGGSPVYRIARLAGEDEEFNTEPHIWRGID